MFPDKLPQSFKMEIEDDLNESKLFFFVFHLSPFEILYVNKNLQKKWSYHMDILSKEPARISEMVIEKDRANFTHKVIENPQDNINTTIEFRMDCPKKKKQWCRLKLYAVQTQQSPDAFIAFAEDITKLKQEHLVSREEFQNLKSEINILNHDLKGFMGSIISLSNLIRDSINPEEQQKMASYFNVLKKLFDAYQEYTENFFSKHLIKPIVVLLDYQHVDIVKEIYDIVDLFYGQLKDKQIETEISIERKEIIVSVDKVKFQQIINNLLSNAIKFSNENGKIILAIIKSEDHILLTISDKGLGIPKKYYSHIFKENSPAMRPGTKGEKSSGIGTYIAKKMVDLHDGEIWFKSKVGKGTTFFVKLPLSNEK